MRVINICTKDNANFSFTNCEAMKSVGIDARSFVLRSHPFGYTHQSLKSSWKGIRVEIQEAAIIQIMHSDHRMIPLLEGFNKRVIVYHAGTKYRQDPDSYNRYFNPIVEKSVIALGEFSGKGCKDEHYLVGAIDTDNISPVYTCNYDYRKIRHHPSNAGTKGMPDIVSMMAGLPKDYLSRIEFKYTGNNGRVDAQANLIRVADCDVYVEMFKLKQKEKDYGSFGITALEAAALGKVVVTNNLWYELYEKEYGYCMLQIANTKRRFEQLIMHLVDMPDKDLLKIQEDTRKWIIDKHSLQSTGQRIKVMILEI